MFIAGIAQVSYHNHEGYPKFAHDCFAIVDEEQVIFKEEQNVIVMSLTKAKVTFKDVRYSTSSNNNNVCQAIRYAALDALLS